ncbi:hypothetical protein [Sandaracinus amylolyticus]|uniref:hypothetical protein n=1 Tax=Sandaracinus amylolyticus TaxID=927083 RepID=UPI001F3F5432|nr:hypothetical protein [Sandaracinus amylolyticus]UJR82520.1 Hypothetical protein I5071_45850 [Sandaracinus amylolyticus]
MREVRRAWIVALFAVIAAGCSCEPSAPVEDEDASEPEWDGAFFRCAGSQDDTPTEETLAAAIEQIDVWEDGEISVPLGPLGCVRYERVIEGGVLVESRVVREIDVEYDVELGGFVPVIVTLAEWTRGTDGVVRGRLQADDEVERDDTFFEIEETIGAGRLERVFRNPSSREIEERTVIERRDDGFEWQTRDELVDGALTTVSDTRITDEHLEQDGGGGGECEIGDCDAATSERLSRLMRQVVQRGFDCLMSQGADRGDVRARSLIAIGLMWNSARSFQCATGSCGFYGRWCLDCQLDGETLQMTLLIDGRTDAQLSETIFHEIMHGAVGVHDEDMVQLVRQDGDTEYQMLRYTDPVYACTEFCFGSTAYRNSCSCAACFRVRTCHDLCAGAGGCVARDAITREVVMSEAVGAACRTEGEPTTFHRTMAACQGACTGGTCRSYSRSCDPTCK